MIHTVKVFSIVNEADVFLEFCCFFDDPTDVGNLVSGFSAFTTPASTSGILGSAEVLLGNLTWLQAVEALLGKF